MYKNEVRETINYDVNINNISRNWKSPLENVYSCSGNRNWKIDTPPIKQLTSK